MNRCPLFWVAMTAIVCLCGWPAVSAEPAPPRVNDDRLRVTLFAADPQIVTPIGIACDRQGRVFVLESHTHLPASNYPGPKFDRVQVFEDADGDGRADRVRTFADRIDQGMNLAFAPDGVLHVVTAKQVLSLADANGDGVCDDKERRLLVRLETEQDYPHSQLLGLTFSHDGQMIVSRGNVGGCAYAWVGSDGRRIAGYGEGGDIVGCRPDGTGIQRVAVGFWNPFDVRFDRCGRLLCVDNDPDSRGPNRLLHIVRGGDYGFRALYGPAGLHPYDAWEGDLPGTLPMIAGVGEAPSAVLDLSFTGLPDDYRGAIAVTVWGEHNVSLVRPVPRGASLGGKAERWIEGDNEFRPVGLAVAPDGSVYVTDWVLKDYPNHGRGRVWRVAIQPGVRGMTPTDPHAVPWPDDGAARLAAIEHAFSPASARSPKEEGASPPTADDRLAVLSGALAADDPFVRSAAVFALSQVPRTDAAQQLWKAQEAKVRLGALLALRRAGEPPHALLREALRDRDEEIRIVALMAVGDGVITDLAAEVDRAGEGETVGARLFEVWLATKQILASDVASAYRRRERGFAIRRDWPAALIASIVQDEGRSPALRALALPRLTNANDPALRQTLHRLAADATGPLQREAIRSLAASAHAETGAVLRSLALDARRPPLIRAEALAALSHQPNQMTAELAPLLVADQPLVAIQAARSLRLLAMQPNHRAALERAATESPWDAVREILRFALGQPTEPRPASLDDWQQRLAAGGDPAAGERLFFTAGVACMQCHRVGNRGGAVGPDLSVVGRTADRVRLIRSLVQPADDIAPQFQGWVVVTTDGQVITGLQGHLRTGGAVTIIDLEGRTRNIPGERVETFGALTKSLMPDDLAQTMPVADLQDLVAWLATLQ